MKFAIGYQHQPYDEPFSRLALDFLPYLAEIFFPWRGVPSGRAAIGTAHYLGSGTKKPCGMDEAQEILENELKVLRRSGLKLDLLFNANCYGEDAVSDHFEKTLLGILADMDSKDLLPEIITTTSLFVAERIKKHYPDIEIRASVNMRIDSIPSMEYLSKYFDTFHIRRDLQRNLDTVVTFNKWCTDNGKKLHMLANSGCLINCPGHTFHDNLVSHLSEIEKKKNVKGFIWFLCRKVYDAPEKLEEFIKSSWLRPEDLKYYEQYFPVVKLATRNNSDPRTILEAYTSGHFNGNVLAITEPRFAELFSGFAIRNSLFPDGWFLSVAGLCAARCTHCGKCRELLNSVLVMVNQ